MQSLTKPSLLARLVQTRPLAADHDPVHWLEPLLIRRRKSGPVDGSRQQISGEQFALLLAALVVFLCAFALLLA